MYACFQCDLGWIAVLLAPPAPLPAPLDQKGMDHMGRSQSSCQISWLSHQQSLLPLILSLTVIHYSLKGNCYQKVMLLDTSAGSGQPGKADND